MSDATIPTAKSAPPGAWRRASGYVRLVHPFPVAMNAVAADAFAMIAARSWPGARAIVLLAAAIIGSQSLVGIVNDVRDRALDAQTKPQKPLVSGRATLPGATILGAVMGIVALAAGVALGWLSLALVIAMTGAGLVYDLWLKRTAFSFLPYVLGLPILPIWAWTAVRDAPARLWLTYPLGILIGLGLHLANAMPDAERDAAGGVRGIVQVVGRRGSLTMCVTSFAATIILVAALTGPHRSGLTLLLLIAAALLLSVPAVLGVLYPTADTLQRNWGILIGCAICVASAWLYALR